MEYNQYSSSVLEQLEKNSRKQVLFAGIQCVLSIAAVVLCLVLLLVVARVVPQIQEMAEQVSALAEQAETTLANVDALAVSSQTGMEQIVEKIGALDIETLNEAIQNLADAVAPLANFAKRWS